MSLSEFGLEGGATSSEGVPACHAMDLPLLTLIEGIHRASLSCHDQQVHRSTIDRKACMTLSGWNLLIPVAWPLAMHCCTYKRLSKQHGKQVVVLYQSYATGDR